MVVKENIDFKRGQSSKESLDIGKYRKIYPPLNWKSMASGMYLMKDYDNNYSLLFWDKDKKDAKISDFAKTPAKAMNLDPRKRGEGVPLDYLEDFGELLIWIKKVED